MNWFLYIGGWGLGVFVITEHIFRKTSSNDGAYLLVGFWTLTWVWICWKFIRNPKV